MTPIKVIVYYRSNSSKLAWFGIIWLVCPKHYLWGIFSTQFLSKNANFMSEFKKIGKYEVLKFTIPSNMLLSKVIFKIYSSHLCSTWMRNCYFLTKTESEKCPIMPVHLPGQNVFCPGQNVFSPRQNVFVPDKITFVPDKNFCPCLQSSYLLGKRIENEFKLWIFFHG